MTPGGGSESDEDGLAALPDARAARARFDLDGKVAFVTGAASGLGRAIAWGLACFGADVAVCDLNAPGAQAAAGEIGTRLGRRTLAVELDVTDAAQVDAAVARVVGELGRIDVCVNSAGINHRREALELAPGDFRRVLDVNLTGTLLCATATARDMLRRRRGKVINLASVLGHSALPRQAAYAASKHGVVGLSRVLALEWAPHGIQVNALAPAHHDTPLTQQLPPELRAEALARIPQRRFPAASEIIPPAVFLATSASDFMTGASLNFDGGWSA